jgi:zinc transport system permease protein
MNEFLIYSIIAGVVIVSSLCPLGCIVLWRRIPYFGDAIAHSSILGIVLGLMLNINITIAIILVSMVFAILLILLHKEAISDILIVIFSYGFLSLGLFMIPFIISNTQVDIFSYLFGDILLVDDAEIKLSLICSIFVLLWIFFRWKKLLLISINEDLAVVEGINLKRINLEFMLITAFMIAVSIKIVGVMLIAAMLIIPSTAARNLSTSPVQMLFFSIAIGIMAVSVGIISSYMIDSPSGPSIILSSLMLYVLSLIFKSKRA